MAISSNKEQLEHDVFVESSTPGQPAIVVANADGTPVGSGGQTGNTMQSQGLDATGQDAYATVKTPSADATHILVSCGSNGAIISLDAGTSDHFSVQPNMVLALDAVTITSGVAIQAKNLTGGSNYTNLSVSIW